MADFTTTISVDELWNDISIEMDNKPSMEEVWEYINREPIKRTRRLHTSMIDKCIKYLCLCC